ncbi:MAG: hypothetical protein WC273_11665 [Dehalococcoidia bacterium]
MRDSGGRQTLRLALGAGIAGFAWGYRRHRAHPRRTMLALLQAAEWFVACGGAATLVDVLRDTLAGGDDETTERVTHTTQTVTDHGVRA